MFAGHWRAWTAAAERLMAVTLPLSLAAILIWAWPGWAECLQLNPHQGLARESWRLVTCHFAHWSLHHLAWDLVMFAGLGMLCEWRSRARFLASLAGAAVAIPLIVAWVHPDLAYRGLSGLDSALFGLLAGSLLRERWAARQIAGLVVVLIMTAGFAGKIGYELAVGQAFFVDDPSMLPVPIAHVSGAVIGLGVGLLWNQRFLLQRRKDENCEGRTGKAALRHGL